MKPNVIKRHFNHHLCLYICFTIIFGTFFLTREASAASKIKLSKTSVTMKAGKSKTLKLKKNGKKLKAKFSSNKPKIAKVGKKSGKITSKKKGKCTITAKYGGKKYKCKVKVTKNNSKKSTINKNLAPEDNPNNSSNINGENSENDPNLDDYSDIGNYPSLDDYSNIENNSWFLDDLNNENLENDDSSLYELNTTKKKPSSNKKPSNLNSDNNDDNDDNNDNNTNDDTLNEIYNPDDNTILITEDPYETNNFDDTTLNDGTSSLFNPDTTKKPSNNKKPSNSNNDTFDNNDLYETENPNDTTLNDGNSSLFNPDTTKKPSNNKKPSTSNNSNNNTSNNDDLYETNNPNNTTINDGTSSTYEPDTTKKPSNNKEPLTSTTNNNNTSNNNTTNNNTSNNNNNNNTSTSNNENSSSSNETNFDTQTTDQKHYLTPYWTDNINVYNNQGSSFTMGGKKYTQGICQPASANSGTSKISRALYNLDSKFNTVSFDVSCINYSDKSNTSLSIYADDYSNNNCIEQFNIFCYGKEIKHFTINTTGVKQLQIVFFGAYGVYGIGNLIGNEGHIFECKEVKPATAQQNGTIYYQCKYCNENYTQTIPAQIECKPTLVPCKTKNIRFLNSEYGGESFKVMGKEYYKGILPDYSNNSIEWTFPLDKKYKSLTFSVAPRDNKFNEKKLYGLALYIYADRKTLQWNGKDYILLGTLMPSQTFTINTEGISELRFSSGGSIDEYFAFFDITYETVTKNPHEFQNVNGKEKCINCGCYKN